MTSKNRKSGLSCVNKINELTKNCPNSKPEHHINENKFSISIFNTNTTVVSHWTQPQWRRRERAYTNYQGRLNAGRVPSTTPCDQSTRTPSSSERSLSSGRSYRCSPISGAAFGTRPNSTPIATSNPPTATLTIYLSTPPASTSTPPSSPVSAFHFILSLIFCILFPPTLSHLGRLKKKGEKLFMFDDCALDIRCECVCSYFLAYYVEQIKCCNHMEWLTTSVYGCDG